QGEQRDGADRVAEPAQRPHPHLIQRDLHDRPAHPPNERQQDEQKLGFGGFVQPVLRDQESPLPVAPKNERTRIERNMREPSVRPPKLSTGRSLHRQEAQKKQSVSVGWLASRCPLAYSARLHRDGSLPGLTRQSIIFARSFLQRAMDHSKSGLPDFEHL